MKTFFVLLIFIAANLDAQVFVQTVRGRVVDGQSISPVANAIVEVRDSGSFLFIDTCDSRGYFQILNVPAGRINIKVTATNYIEYNAYDIIHQSGKETVLEIELFEKVSDIKGGGVKAKSKGGLNNSNISLSARSFEIEDTRRYAGSRNDPARMASNFAGVVGNNDSRNDIIIRGNSPQGLLWRMEGIDIPNPNHFGAMGASGGPVTILNNNVLSRSDFMTGAFPAAYGNATAGVFDLQMRKGNKSKQEFTGQIGFNGFEAGAEGPLNRQNKSSYLFNYRYSTLAILQKIGMNFGTGTAIPYYQDISFKIDLPFKKDHLSIFGIGGISNIHFEYEDSRDSSNLYSNGNQDLKYRTSMGVAGLSYTRMFSNKLYLKTSIGSTYTGVETIADSVGDSKRVGVYRDKSRSSRLILNSVLNYKHNASKLFSLGINVQNIGFNFIDSVRENNNLKALRNDKGSTVLFQAFATYQYKFSQFTTLNTGLHYQQLTLNNSNALEPRIGITHQINRKQKLSIGAGMHSQIQNLQMYFLKTELNTGSIQTNKSLGMSKSIHTVAAYEYQISRYWRFKTEVYYQHVYNIPVTTAASYYSALNEGADFNTPATDSLTNKGTGKNLGLEITIEKNFNKGFYTLNSLSIYDSKYKGSNGIEKNTAFNGQFIFNTLCGKEIKLGRKNILAFDTKISIAGGRRYTPIDLAASRFYQRQIYINEQTFDKQFDTYFRIDFKLSYRRNGNKISQEWFVDIQNITNRKNIFIQGYDAIKGDIVTQYQLGLFPNFNYRINF